MEGNALTNQLRDLFLRVSFSQHFSQLASVCDSILKVNIGRSISLGVFAFTSTVDDTLQLFSVILWGVPTLLTVIAFSLFAYFISKLNIEIERLQHLGGNSSVHSTNVETRFQNKAPSRKRTTYISLGQQPQYKRRRINLLVVPLFIFCNLLAVISYSIIILSCK